MTTRRQRRLLQAGGTLLLLAVVYLLRSRVAPEPAPMPPPGTSARAPSTSILEAFRARRSNVELVTGGRVERVLADDREGSRHQRFLVRVAGGVSVLVAHNIDLAPRVPLATGDSVEVRGEYEWTERGGVLHWTHRDPEGRREGGWVRLDGRLYR